MTCGIYAIINTVTGRVYVGQSRNIERRWNSHRHLLNVQNNESKNQHLFNSWHKYGSENFQWEILQECLPEKLDQLERFWILYFEPNVYNGMIGSYDSTLGLHPSEEVKAKISASQKGKIPWNKGKRHSSETLRKISEALQGHRKGIHFSEEHKAKLSASNKGKHGGKPLSKETREKISKATKGKIKRSEETRKKMSIAQKLRYAKEREQKDD